MCGKTVYDRISNVDIRKECKADESIMNKIMKGSLRWFGHMERMDEGRMVKKLYASDVVGKRSRGRPRKTWHDQINQSLDVGHVRSRNNRRACMIRGMNVEEARIVCQDRRVWRSILRGHGVMVS